MLRKCLRFALVAVVIVFGSTAIFAQGGTLFVEGDKVGVGVDPSTLPLPVLLNVKGSAPLDALIKVQNTAGNGFSGLEFLNAGGTPGFFFGVNNNNNSTRLNSFNNFPFLLMTNSVERIRITSSGNVGFSRQSPLHPIHVGTDSTNGNGAHLTAAGVWTVGSSRTNKDKIRQLDYQDAIEALAGLEPVRYFGSESIDGEEYLGFIAEDVPELVAMNDRQGLSAMDIVAVLAKVTQEQQRTMSALGTRIAELENQADLHRCQVSSGLP